MRMCTLKPHAIALLTYISKSGTRGLGSHIEAACSCFATLEKQQKYTVSSLPTPARTDWQRVWVSGFPAGGDVRVCQVEVSGTFHEDQATLPRLVVSKAHYSQQSLQGHLFQVQIPGPSRFTRAGNLHFNSSPGGSRPLQS